MAGDRSSWHWLLLVPIVIPMLPVLYNGTEPHLFGFPRFYWMQLSFVGLGAACVGIVYWKTKHPK